MSTSTHIDQPLPFAIGQVIEYDYPRHNFEGVPGRRMERRAIRVDSIRDLELQPLADETMAQNPLQRRSQYLVTGYDLRKHAERSFYVGSMENLSIVDPPPRSISSNGGYQVWIAEETEEFSGIATLTPVEYVEDLEEALAYSNRFNRQELREPISAWAIIRRGAA